MADKMKDALHEEADNFKAAAHDVAVSGAYLYPVKVSSEARQHSGYLFD
jgi:hypothetical protein